MHKKFILSYLFIVVTLLILLSLSRSTSEKMRGNFVSIFAPLWETLASIRSSSHSSENQYEHPSGQQLSPLEEVQRLQLENQLLNNELLHASALLEDKQLLDQKVADLSGVKENQAFDATARAYLQRLKHSLSFKIHALPARIIFRSLGTWNSSFWINVGEADNLPDMPKTVAKNSPVLVGNSIIGVIDYVGKHQARVCLITDPQLTPSVRVARGGEQEALLLEHIEFLARNLKQKKTLLINEDDRQVLMQILTQIKQTLQPSKKNWYLAKGELQGSIRSSGRLQSQILKGSGFNYDFSDEQGEARDLRTGQILNQPQSAPLAILKLNDVLVTTGLDGIFPPNLQVATITKIDLLKEGDYFYELEAKATAGNLNELSFVLVIPPLTQEASPYIAQP
jgi:cell shape-determining protein MreC